MRIFFNTPNKLLSGGPPTHLPILERELRKSVVVINYNYGRRKDKETIFEKIIFRFFDLIVFSIKLFCNRPDLIHLNSAADSRAILRDFILVLTTNLFRVPVFIKFHGSFDPEYYQSLFFLYRYFRNYILKNVAKIGVLSKEEKCFYENTVPGMNGKVEIVKNIIKEDFFNVNRKISEYPTVLFISRCLRQKGIFELLKAVPFVLMYNSNTKFVFIGSGNDSAEFDNRVNEMQLGESVRRYESVDNSDTIKFYKSAWIFVFPTQKPEGMPMVVAETMSAGIPLITSKTRFSLSYMTEFEHCLFINPFDIKSIAEKIIILLDDSKMRDKMSSNLKKMSTLFAKEMVTQEYLRIYNSIKIKG